MHYIYLYTCILIVYLSLEYNEGAERANYLNLEKPVIAYYNKEYVKEVKCISRRLSRKDPRYYINIYIHIYFPIDNNLHLDFYLYEYVQANVHRRTLMELHFRACDLIEKDQYIGRAIRQHWVNKNMTCPYPPGAYSIQNMTMPLMSSLVPIKRGRVYINVTRDVHKKNAVIISSYIDLEVKKI